MVLDDGLDELADWLVAKAIGWRVGGLVNGGWTVWLFGGLLGGSVGSWLAVAVAFAIAASIAIAIQIVKSIVFADALCD